MAVRLWPNVIFFAFVIGFLEAGATARLVGMLSDGKALGYSNNRKLFVTADNTAFIAARVRDSSGHFNTRLYRSQGPWPVAAGFDSLDFSSQGRVDISNAPQRAPALAIEANGVAQIVWYGGNSNLNSDPRFARQIRFGKIADVAGHLTQVLLEEPFSVTGFASAYKAPYEENDYWQEHPSSALGPDGTLYLVWEAHDSQRITSGKPAPGVAFATRSAQGIWSTQGSIKRPPYIEVSDGISKSQSRPSIVYESSQRQHVLAYGKIRGKQKLLYSLRSNGKFLVWTQVDARSTQDQRHGTISVDKSGKLHAIWREGGSASSIVIRYSSKEAGGWSVPTTISRSGFNASTPAITVVGSKIYAAWVEWLPGEINSKGEADNGFPSDSNVVEGTLVYRTKISSNNNWDNPRIGQAKASYPDLSSSVENNVVMSFTTGSECKKIDCVSLWITDVP